MHCMIANLQRVLYNSQASVDDTQYNHIVYKHYNFATQYLTIYLIDSERGRHYFCRILAPPPPNTPPPPPRRHNSQLSKITDREGSINFVGFLAPLNAPSLYRCIFL